MSTFSLPDHKKLAESPQEELRRYIEELLTEDLPWYERQARSHYFYWLALQFTAMICVALSGLIAALADVQQFTAIGRIAIVSLSFLSTLAITWLVTFRHREMEDFRERAHLALKHAVNEARASLTTAKEPDAVLAVHKKLRDFVDNLDMQQHERAHSILSNPSNPTVRQ